MIDWSKELLLYHGSFCVVPNPDLSQCRPNKDFGLGFYVTTSLEQAKRFVPSAIKKAERNRRMQRGSRFGFVTSYRFSLPDALRLFAFSTADAEWLHCVAAHRQPDAFPAVKREMESYDLISGKIANDQTNATLTAYLSGLYGVLGSEEADNDCIRRLLPERLENQICFRTQAALNALQYEGEEIVWIREL